MPKNALAGQYKVKVEGQLVDNPSGYVFYREADLLFDSKQASVFIQMSKPVYCQGQKGKMCSTDLCRVFTFDFFCYTSSSSSSHISVYRSSIVMSAFRQIV